MAILSQPARFSTFFRKHVKKYNFFYFLAVLGSKNSRKKVEIEGVGPIWRDPRRNSAYKPALGLKNGWMATQLVTKRLIFGPLGFRARLAHPWALGPGGCRQAADFWLACCAQPWLGLAWACLACLACLARLACLALDCSSNNNRHGREG